MRSASDWGGGNPPHLPKWTGSRIGHGGDPPALPAPPRNGLEPKKSTKIRGAARVLPGEPKPHQVFHQPSNVEPRWACTSHVHMMHLQETCTQQRKQRPLMMLICQHVNSPNNELSKQH